MASSMAYPYARFACQSPPPELRLRSVGYVSEVTSHLPYLVGIGFAIVFAGMRVAWPLWIALGLLGVAAVIQGPRARQESELRPRRLHIGAPGLT